MRHEDIDIGGCLVHVVPRDNANGMRAKGGRGRAVPAGAPLMRLYADYLNREYGAVGLRVRQPVGCSRWPPDDLPGRV